MSEKNFERKIDEQQLKQVNGGYGGDLYTLTVYGCEGSLPLLTSPDEKQATVLAYLGNGSQVSTIGETQGSYSHVCYNGQWGWILNYFLVYM